MTFNDLISTDSDLKVNMHNLYDAIQSLSNELYNSSRSLEWSTEHLGMGCNEIIPENDHAQIMEYCTCILYYLWDSRFLFEIPIDLGRFPLDPLLWVELSSCQARQTRRAATAGR